MKNRLNPQRVPTDRALVRSSPRSLWSSSYRLLVQPSFSPTKKPHDLVLNTGTSAKRKYDHHRGNGIDRMTFFSLTVLPLHHLRCDFPDKYLMRRAI
jgi:hypothetical protein